ncbi:MAG TPA: serine/threonine-protein kinase [Ktedonobacteraceae bacterium]|nr:serine/threonine-protein kinase [Ktedonobacteraceae bacterium]
MISSNMFFCEECGAANPADAAQCYACQHAFDSSSAFTVSPLVIAPASKPIQVVVPAVPALSVTAYAGNLLNQRYQIRGEIGQGGFGVVYKARDTQNHNRFVAIKQINLDMLSARQVIEATDSYNREVTLLSRLQHKNLPRIYEHFTDATHWYLVMEYIEGETLEDYIKRKGPLIVKETLEAGVQLANVLDYLHSQKPPIIFRDVKPANIMRTSNGHLYLIDFGIARLFNPEKKRDTGPLGSPGYAAPEQYGTAQSTGQTDIYGLGATLNTLLLGDDENDSKGSAPLPKIPGKLQQLLDQMLESNASKRPKSMQTVMQRLQNMQQNTTDLIVKYLKNFFWGLLIGSFPYPLLLLYMLVSIIPFVNTMLGTPVLILAQLFFSLWPLVVIIQFLAATAMLFTSRRRLIGAGIFVMMGIVLLAISSGWIPWPLDVFNTMLHPSFPFAPPHHHFRGNGF